MPELNLDLDPCNPALVYACCGLLLLASFADPLAEAWFEADSALPQTARFHLRSAKSLDLAGFALALKTAAWSPVLQTGTDTATAPITVTLPGRTLQLDWWLEPFWEDSNEFKFWAGQVTSKKLFDELPALVDTETPSLDTFTYTTTRIGLDPRATWVALNLGYSPNEHNQKSRTYPLTELLAAIGLQQFRPACANYHCRYSLPLVPLSLPLARTALLRPWPGLPALTYAFAIQRRGRYKYFDFAQLKENSDVHHH